MRSTAFRPKPAHTLIDEEHLRILEVCNQSEFSNLPPSQTIPALLDKGRFIASRLTFYRVLKAQSQLFHRGAVRKER